MKTFNCWSWASVSTKIQATEVSLDDQVAENNQFIKEIGKHYPDCNGVLIGETRLVGTRTIPSLDEACRRHPDAYGELVKMIKGGSIDIIVCRDRDRLGGRKLGLSSQLFDLCESSGILVIATRARMPMALTMDAIRLDESRLLQTAIEGALSETFMQRFVAKSRMGREARAKNKKLFTGSPPYGYRYRVDDNGRQWIAVDEACRTSLRAIFTMYLSGHGEIRIGDELNRLGIPAPSGGRWYRGALSPIISRAYTYAGYIEMHRGQSERHFMILGDHEAIIDYSTACDVQKERSERSVTRSIPHTPFAGVCICINCGKGMVANKSRHRRTDGSERVYATYECKNPNCGVPCRIATSAIRKAVEEAIREATIQPDDQLITDFDPSDIEGYRHEVQCKIHAIETEIGNKQEGLTTLVDLLMEKRISRQIFDDMSNTLNRSISAFQVSLDEKRDEISFINGKTEIAERLREIREEGRNVLAKEEREPEAVSRWLRARLRIYVRPTRSTERIERVEYI